MTKFEVGGPWTLGGWVSGTIGADSLVKERMVAGGVAPEFEGAADTRTRRIGGSWGALFQ